jgi:peptidoglycan/xylan/chitin deacetylase (PgdA/CDA1 family)
MLPDKAIHGSVWKKDGFVSALGRVSINVLSPGGLNSCVSILIFHRVLLEKDPLFPGEVDATEFEQQLRFLKSFMNFVSLSDAVSGIRSGRLPPRAACITFDDGYADNADVALPILQSLDIPATFFIATGFLNGGRMWNDSVIEMVRAARGPRLDFGAIDLGSFDVNTTLQRQQTISSLIGRLKYLPLDDRAAQITRMCDHLKCDLPADLMMTSAQVKHLCDSGMEIGGHTVSHPILARLRRSDAQREIVEGKESLQDIIRKPVRFFAYPNGKPGQDYLPEHVELVRELGFDAAVSTAWGAMPKDADLYQLPRFTPWDRTAQKFMLRVAKNLMGKAQTV